MITIGERIRSWRKDLGLTQHHIADMVGISRVHVGMIELGMVKNPSPRTLQKIAQALGVTLDQLVENVNFLIDEEVDQ